MMKLVLLVGLVLLANINCGSKKVWMKNPKRAYISPSSRDITVDVQNDVKNKVLKFNVTITKSNFYGHMYGSYDLIIFDDNEYNVAEIITYNYGEYPTLYEVCKKNGKTIIDSYYSVKKYLKQVQQKKGRVGANGYSFGVSFERQYGKDYGQCSKLNVKASTTEIKKGLKSFSHRQSIGTHDITYDYESANISNSTNTSKSANIIKLGLMVFLVLLNVYLF